MYLNFHESPENKPVLIGISYLTSTDRYTWNTSVCHQNIFDFEERIKDSTSFELKYITETESFLK